MHAYIHVVDVYAHPRHGTNQPTDPISTYGSEYTGSGAPDSATTPRAAATSSPGTAAASCAEADGAWRECGAHHRRALPRAPRRARGWCARPRPAGARALCNPGRRLGKCECVNTGAARACSVLPCWDAGAHRPRAWWEPPKPGRRRGPGAPP